MNTPISLFQAQAAAVWQSNSREALEGELHAALADRELLLRELTHRIRNTLQLIGSLLNRQAGRMADAEARGAFAEAYQRIMAIAGAYKGLDSGHIGCIEFGEYLRDLCHRLLRNVPDQQRTIALSVDAASGMLDLDRAIPLGLIVNELVGTALTCMAEGNATGEITVRYGEDGQSRHCLAVSTCFAAMEGNHPRVRNRLELDLVRAFVHQIDGTLTIEHNSDLNVDITFPPPDRGRCPRTST